jgi:hypothetical protein
MAERSILEGSIRKDDSIMFMPFGLIWTTHAMSMLTECHAARNNLVMADTYSIRNWRPN